MRRLPDDVAIIGAGPVGLFAVFALGQVGLSSVLIDSLSEIGGQCAALYPEKPIYDIPSRPSVSGADLIQDLRRQMKPYAPRQILGVRVQTLAEEGGFFQLGLSDGSSVSVRAVLVAAGAGAFAVNRPPLSHIQQYEGVSVFYSVRDPELFRNKHVVIAGGGDSAADWAVALSRIASSVTLIHRRTTFRAAPATLAAMASLARDGKLSVLAPATLAGLEGADQQLNAVVLRDDAGGVSTLASDALLCFFGLAKDLSALASWKIGAGKHNIPVDPATMQTFRRGVFAIGDIAEYPGKLKLILSGFAEAATAAHAARSHLHPGKKFHFEYSTTMGLPALDKEKVTAE